MRGRRSLWLPVPSAATALKRSTLAERADEPDDIERLLGSKLDVSDRDRKARRSGGALARQHLGNARHQATGSDSVEVAWGLDAAKFQSSAGAPRRSGSTAADRPRFPRRASGVAQISHWPPDTRRR